MWKVSNLNIIIHTTLYLTSLCAHTHFASSLTSTGSYKNVIHSYSEEQSADATEVQV